VDRVLVLGLAERVRTTGYFASQSSSTTLKDEWGRGGSNSHGANAPAASRAAASSKFRHAPARFVGRSCQLRRVGYISISGVSGSTRFAEATLEICHRFCITPRVDARVIETGARRCLVAIASALGDARFGHGRRAVRTHRSRCSASSSSMSNVGNRTPAARQSPSAGAGTMTWSPHARPRRLRISV